VFPGSNNWPRETGRNQTTRIGHHEGEDTENSGSRSKCDPMYWWNWWSLSEGNL